MVHEGIELGSSEVIPIESLEKRPTEFIPTRAEWSADNRERVMRFDRNLGTETSTMFTVPAGRKLFLTNLVMSCRGDAINAGVSIVSLGLSGSGQSIRLDVTKDGSETVSVGFVMPFKIPEAGTIILDTNNIGSATVSFIGWLE